MNKRSLWGSGVAGAAVLMVSIGTWINQGVQPASTLDVPLPPGAVEIVAEASEKPVASPLPVSEVQSNSPPAPILTAVSSVATAASPSPLPLVVFVSGAVKRPGVYHLKPGTRIEGAIFAAGGFKPNSQTDMINLADPAHDGDHIIVGTRTAPTAAPQAAPPRSTIVAAQPPASLSKPSQPTLGRVLGYRPAPVPVAAVVPPLTSDEAAKESSPASPAANTKFKNPGDGMVNLNTASAEELTRLPGVGPSTAAHIIAHRKTEGAFADISQIQDVKGIGPKKYAKMQAFLSVK